MVRVAGSPTGLELVLVEFLGGFSTMRSTALFLVAYAVLLHLPEVGAATFGRGEGALVGLQDTNSETRKDFSNNIAEELIALKNKQGEIEKELQAQNSYFLAEIAELKKGLRLGSEVPKVPDDMQSERSSNSTYLDYLAPLLAGSWKESACHHPITNDYSDASGPFKLESDIEVNTQIEDPKMCLGGHETINKHFQPNLGWSSSVPATDMFRWIAGKVVLFIGDSTAEQLLFGMRCSLAIDFRVTKFDSNGGMMPPESGVSHTASQAEVFLESPKGNAVLWFLRSDKDYPDLRLKVCMVCFVLTLDLSAAQH